MHYNAIRQINMENEELPLLSESNGSCMAVGKPIPNFAHLFLR